MASLANDSYVTSYVCPQCKALGFARPDGGFVGAIRYRLPLPLHLECAKCGGMFHLIVGNSNGSNERSDARVRQS